MMAMPSSPRASQRVILAVAGAGLAFRLVVAWLTLGSDHVEDRGFEAALTLLVGWAAPRRRDLPVLTDRGLGPGLEMLASRAPVPVDVAGDVDDLPPAVATAVYFVVSEGLTNVAKYARARHATVTVSRDHNRVVAEVADDGVGGAGARAGNRPARARGPRGRARRPPQAAQPAWERHAASGRVSARTRPERRSDGLIAAAGAPGGDRCGS